MKLKIKFDQKTILDFLIQNVEKIVLGVFLLVTLFILYSSLSNAGHFDKAPKQLQDAVSQAKSSLQSTTPEGYIEELKAASLASTTDPADPNAATAGPATLEISNYVKQAEKSRVDIEENPYLTAIPWDPPLFEKRPLRVEPALFTVQELRASPGIGAFRITQSGRTTVRDETPARPARPARDDRAPGLDDLGGGQATGGEQTRGKHWIVLTGLVPIEKQERAYADSFKQSLGYDPQNDYPEYLGFIVERVEVENTGDAAPDWTKAKKIVGGEAIRIAANEWTSTRESEVVAQDYINERLVFPLGPLVNRNWDDTVAHEPKVPMLKTNDPTRGGATRGEGRAMPRGGGLDERMGPGMLGARGARRDAAPVGDTPFGAEAPAADEALVDETPQEDTQLTGPPAYKLFRFFDFDVEPGKHYVYRVCLGLRNPNHGVKPTYLKSPDLAKSTYLQTKWSDPSSAVSAPRDTRILLVSVKPGRLSTDTSAEILMTTWIQRKGVEVYKTFTVTRGQVLNYSDEKGQVVGTAEEPPQRPTREAREPAPGRGPAGMEGPLGREIGGLEELGRGRGRDRERPERDRERAPALLPAGSDNTYTTNFNSNAVIIDLRGGDKLTGRRAGGMTSSGELLLLNVDGVLVVHNELDDETIRKDLTTPKQADAIRGLGPGGPMRGEIPFGLDGLGIPGGRDR